MEKKISKCKTYPVPGGDPFCEGECHYIKKEFECTHLGMDVYIWEEIDDDEVTLPCNTGLSADESFGSVNK